MVEREFFNFNRSSESDVRYFVIFPNEEEKQAFTDTFCSDAMNNWRAPFASATADDVLVAIIMVRESYIEGWKTEHPLVRFVEAKKFEASWGDYY